MGSGFDEAIYLTFTRRSYNYLLHSLTPHKLKILSSLSCILAPGFLIAIPSPVVFCLSAVSQHLSSSVIPCSVLFLVHYSFCTGPRSVLYCLLADESSSIVKVKVKVTLRLTVSQSVSLVFVGRPLWREDGSIFCICCWPSPAHSFSGPSSLGLATIFYCLRFETSLFVASYDSQGHGGGIRPRPHTGDPPPGVQ
jgi:hypothetical protein